MSDIEREIAQKTQEKFEFYVISLVFTLLALSIQTSKFGSSNIADAFELSGWVILLVSGLTGLWRMQFVPVERMKVTQKDEFEDKIFKLKEQQLKGQTEIYILENNSTQPIEKEIEKLQRIVETLKPTIEKHERHNMYKYHTCKLAFVVGLLCLLVARGYEPTKNLILKIIC